MLLPSADHVFRTTGGSGDGSNLVPGSGDRGSTRYARHRCHGRKTKEADRNPCAHAVRAKAPLDHPTAIIGSLATPTGSNFERLIENFDFQPPEIGGQSRLSLTESAMTAVGPDLDLGRRAARAARLPGCTADVRCRLRYGPAGRGGRRNAFKIGVACDPARQGICPDRSGT